MPRSLWLLAALFCFPLALPAQNSFALHNGDTVVFYGDSITDQRLYTSFTETYVVTRFPSMRVRFVHSGWGGDRVTGGGGGPIDLRLHRDVFPFNPTVVTIMLGMNDGGYRAYDQSLFDTYANGYRHIVDLIESALPGVRITAIEPSPYDDITRPPTFEGGYNAVLKRYSQFVRELAASDHLTDVDFNTPVDAMLEKAKAKDPALAQKILPDRVHPGPGGHLIMAEALLKSWHAPSLVSRTLIDAQSSSAIECDNCAVSNLVHNGALTWTETEKSLPMPINWKDPVVALAVHSSDFVSALDDETLRVTGLTPARYTLKIDSTDVATFTADQLASGVNLAEYDTPMSRQAAAVHSLTFKHNDIHFARWRLVQVALDGEGFDDAPAQTALDQLEDQILVARRLAAQPQPHSFALVAAQ
jgi:lysophospholipase L1-like esterase